MVERIRRPILSKIAGLILFLASAAFTLYQNSRIAVLWDLSYLLDTSLRISLGQIPYRDFPFAHAPLTFLLHAAIIHIFGRAYLPHILCAAIESGIATVLTWRILICILNPSPSTNSAGAILDCASCSPESPSLTFLRAATILALPLIFLGIYSIYPHPIYDSDCILAILLAIFLLQRATASHLRHAIAGAVCVLPLFIKQNIGLPFLAITLATVLLLTILRRIHRQTIAPQLTFFAATAATLATALLLIHLTAGLRNYLYWTITFAAQRRLPGLGFILETYHQPSLLWTIPAAIAALVLLRRPTLRAQRWTRPAAILLLAAPFLAVLAALPFAPDAADRADQLLALWPHLLILAAILAISNLRPRTLRAAPTFNTLLPFILLATIHGAFLSQQLWGSTYATWPLLILLIAALLTQIPTIARPLATIIATTLLIAGGLYATSHERLSYIHLTDPALIATQPHATLPELRPLATPGPWLPAFEELVRFTNAEIPPQDAILLLPGEDPFYFATGRTPQFPILLFDPATDPYTPQQTLLEARAHHVRWLIVTRNLQLTAPPKPDLAEVLATLQPDFILDRTLSDYDIYRRR